MSPPGFLLDLDGTLYTDPDPIPGAAEAVAELRRRGASLRFVTNTTRQPHSKVLERLHHLGFDVDVTELFTPAVAARRILTGLGVRTIAPFFPAASLVDFPQFEAIGGTAGAHVAGATAEAVVLGDLGDDWSPARLNDAFRLVMDGAALIALQRGRYWQSAQGLCLDAGPYVAALEFATGREAIVCGKPSIDFFDAVVKSMELPEGAGAPVMVGDDLWNDVAGAQRAGLRGWLVRTGKFRQSVMAESEVAPDRVLDSVADLVAALD